MFFFPVGNAIKHSL